MVAGEVKAKDKVRVAGFPTEVELAKTVRSMPAQVQGKFLAEGSDMMPCVDTNHVVRVFMEHSKDFLGKRGHTMMTDIQGHIYASGARFEEYKFLTPVAKAVKETTGFTIMDPMALVLPKHTVQVLCDERARPYAMCLQQGGSSYNTYGIYGTRPLHDGDHPEMKEDGVDYYPWFRFQETDMNQLEYRKICVWSGDTNGRTWEPMWRAVPAKHVNFKKDMYPTKLGEIKITNDDGDEIMGYMIKKSKLVDCDTLGWHVTCAPGVDPAILICIAACMDDSLPDHKISTSKDAYPWA